MIDELLDLEPGEKYDLTTTDGTEYEDVFITEHYGGGVWFSYHGLAAVYVSAHEFAFAEPRN